MKHHRNCIERQSGDRTGDLAVTSRPSPLHSRHGYRDAQKKGNQRTEDGMRVQGAMVNAFIERCCPKQLYNIA